MRGVFVLQLQRMQWMVLITGLIGLVVSVWTSDAARPAGDSVLYSDTDTISAPVLKRDTNLVLDTCSTGPCLSHNLTSIEDPPAGECRVAGSYGIGSLWINTETGIVSRCIGPLSTGLALWVPDTPSQTLQTICAAGGCQFTDLPVENPFVIAPSGLAQMRLEFKQGGTGLVEECLDADGNTCQPTNILLHTGDQVCINAILGAPPSELPIECWTNTDGTSANFTRNDRGLFANRPQASYTDQTYLVTNCLTAACTAGAGTIRALTRWTGSAWVVDWTSAGGAGAVSGEKCTTLTSVTSSDDNMPLGSFDAASTIVGIWCHYLGSAPTTAATFTLHDGGGNAMTITGTNPTCAAPGSNATEAAVTAGNSLAAHELLAFSVSNTPNPATDTYQVCVAFTTP